MTNFRNLLTASILMLAFAFILGSCKKDATDDLPTPETTQNGNTNGSGTASRSLEDEMAAMDELCFALTYPVSVEMPNGSIQTANDDTGLEVIFEDFYTNNPNATDGPMLQFPLNVLLETGENATLTNEDELFALLETCFEGEWETCFTINYPVTVIYPGGTTEVVNGDLEMMDAFDAWYDANPNSMEDPTLQFPIEVTDVDGVVSSVTNEDDLEALFDGCFDDDWDDDDFELCFDLVFPVTVNLPGGGTQTASDYEALDQIFMDWFEANPNATEFPMLAYPLQVALENGTTVTVNSDDDLGLLLEDCYGDDDDWNDCFSFNYAITIVFPGGTTQAVNSDDELYSAVDAWYAANPNATEDPTLQFPLDVTTADGEVLTVNSEEELDALFEECFECTIGNGGGMAIGNAHAVAATMVLKQHPKVKAAKKERVAQTFAKQKDQ